MSERGSEQAAAKANVGRWERAEAAFGVRRLLELLGPGAAARVAGEPRRGGRRRRAADAVGPGASPAGRRGKVSAGTDPRRMAHDGLYDELFELQAGAYAERPAPHDG